MRLIRCGSSYLHGEYLSEGDRRIIDKANNPDGSYVEGPMWVIQDNILISPEEFQRDCVDIGDLDEILEYSATLTPSLGKALEVAYSAFLDRVRKD